MRKILLTQSQVSIVLTIFISAIVTALLFLTGYTFQQQTLRELQISIKPRIPTRPGSDIEPQPEQNAPSRLFGDSGRSAWEKFRQNEDDLKTAAVAVDWKRLAHVQLVRRHADVCNSIMIFSDLAARRSPARRILLFPQEWALESGGIVDSLGDPYLVTSIRLLRMAARRYAVELRPIAPIVKREMGEDVYSLASTLALVELDRVMHIEAPGTVLDASRFDALLAFGEPAPFATLKESLDDSSTHADDVYLLQPSTARYQDLVEHITRTSNYNDTMFADGFPNQSQIPLSDDNDNDNVLVRSVGTLHNVQDPFNASDFLLTAAYIRFLDPKLPGPEWEVPYEQRRGARPANHDADWLWTELYGQFAQRRADVCGLGLEPWRE